MVPMCENRIGDSDILLFEDFLYRRNPGGLSFSGIDEDALSPSTNYVCICPFAIL